MDILLSRALFVLSIIALIVAFAAGVSDSQIDLFVFAAFVAMCLFLAFGSGGMRGRDAFSPNVVVAGIFLYVYGIGGIRFIVMGNEYLRLAYICGILGLGAFIIGSWLAGHMFLSRIPRLRRPLSGSRVLLGSGAILAVSTIAIIYFVATQGMPAFAEEKVTARLMARSAASSYVIYLIRMSILGFLLILAYWGKRYAGRVPLGHKLFLIVLAAYVSLINLIPGWRGPVFTFLLSCLIVYHFSWASISKRQMVLIGAFFLVAATLWGFIRVVTNPNDGLTNSATAEGVNSIVQMYFIWLTANISVYMLGFLKVLESVPDKIGYLYGGVYVLTAATVLPGEQSTFGVRLKEVSGLEFDGVNLNSSILGDAWADGSFVGVFLYMLVLGFVMTRLYLSMKLSGRADLVVIYAYACTIVILGTMTGLMSQAIYSFNALILVALVLFIRVPGHTFRLQAHEQTSFQP